MRCDLADFAGELGVTLSEQGRTAASQMREKVTGDFVILLANYISEQNPLPTLEALKMHLFEREKIRGRRMHVDAR
jgi:hypothetical protein